jgi:hypothetical protein
VIFEEKEQANPYINKPNSAAMVKRGTPGYNFNTYYTRPRGEVSTKGTTSFSRPKTRPEEGGKNCMSVGIGSGSNFYQSSIPRISNKMSQNGVIT